MKLRFEQSLKYLIQMVINLSNHGQIHNDDIDDKPGQTHNDL